MPAVFGSAAVLQTGVQEGLLLHKLMCPKLRAIPTSQTAYPLAKQHLDKYKEDVDDDERHCGHTRTQSTQRQPSAVKTQRCADQTAQECGQRARCMYVIACSSPIVCCLNAPGLGPIPLPPCSCEYPQPTAPRT